MCAGRRRLPTFVASCAAGVPGAAGVLSGRATLCARGRRPARSPSAPRASLGASARSPARPRRRPRAPQPGPAAADQHRGLAPPPPTSTAAWPSGPSGALHTSGACCAEDDSPRLEARPGPATAHGYLGRSHGPSGTAARPSGPSDALLWCACSGEEALFWIGTVLLDSLLTYPERKNLFRLLFPIQFGGVCQPGGLLAAWQWGFCTT